MKKGIVLIFAFVVLFSCSSDSEDTVECGSVNLISVNQEGTTLNFNYESNGAFNYYQVGYDVSTNISQIDQNSSFNYGFTTTDMSTTSIDDPSLSFFAQENLTMSFYIRAQCSSGELTSWKGPVVIQIEDYCEKPDGLSASGPSLSWNFPSGQTTASFYQVEYGLQGFALGSGTTITTNNTSISNAVIEAGNTYDFYVRASCDSGLGFSSWSGPVSSFADQDYNLCTPPTNVLHEIEYNFFGDPVGVVFRWDLNGETSFEHVLISNGANPDNSASVNTSGISGWPLYSQGLFLNRPYDFYVRAVCVDGSRTEWVGPKNVTIN